MAVALRAPTDQSPLTIPSRIDDSPRGLSALLRAPLGFLRAGGLTEEVVAPQSFKALLRGLDAKDVLTITCIDYRESDREGYLITSAGNVPHKHMIEDLHLVLPGKKALVLRGHTDCAKSKAETPRRPGEPD